VTHSEIDSPIAFQALPPAPSSPRADGADERLGHYQLEEQIGTGGMGIVYRARDLRTGSEVAVKLLKHAHPRAIAAFKREFRALAGIHHENLATLFELAYQDEQWYLAMELVRGGSFVDYAGGDEVRLRDSLGQLARGLRHLHAAGNVHRDVKPSNVLVQPDGRVVVLDFGLVSHLPDRHRTEPGKYVVGTVDFIAPEMVVVGGRLTPACDWYSVGVMLYRCLTGQRPYRGSRYDILRSKIDHDPPHPRDVDPGAPADLAELCAALMVRDPAARAGADEILAAFVA
jgi:serine/threonine protein kinase